MKGEDKAQTLMQMLFGEAAETAQRGASQRLKRWSRAFDEWLRERSGDCGANTSKQARLAWRRLSRQCRKMPWELRREDIEQHARWMQTEGYAPNTIACELGAVSNFYRWCSERQVDARCGAGFNPTEGVKRPRVRRYERADGQPSRLLSREEVEALLRRAERDASELGKRDYAFLLARLRSGVPLKGLQQLRWGQIEEDEQGAWVRWREDGERRRLPEEVLAAIQAFLRASGRLEGMRRETFVFAPLREPGKAETGKEAKDWREGQHLSSSQILANLKLYGRLAGIGEDKLTLLALRRTAVRLRLDEGDSLEEIQEFMGNKVTAKTTKYRLKRLPKLPQGGGEREEEAKAPNRKAKPFQPGEGTKHGFYAHSQPLEAVRRVVAENIQGLEEEIGGLRRLGRGLLEREGKAGRLGEAYSRAANRLAELIKAEKLLAEREKEEEGDEEMLREWDEMALRMGQPPVSEEIRREALGGEPELAVADRRMAEEIAGMRYVLRNTYRLAVESEETEEYIKLVEIYGSGCVRLARMLMLERREQGRVEKYLKEKIDQAIRKVNEEWRGEGWGKDELRPQARRMKKT